MNWQCLNTLPISKELADSTQDAASYYKHNLKINKLYSLEKCFWKLINEDIFVHSYTNINCNQSESKISYWFSAFLSLAIFATSILVLSFTSLPIRFLEKIFLSFFRHQRLALLRQTQVDENSCTVCYDNKANVVIKPCNHK